MLQKTWIKKYFLKYWWCTGNSKYKHIFIKPQKYLGPGNDFVAKAKQLVFGDVGIEGAIMGPRRLQSLLIVRLILIKLLQVLLKKQEHENSQCILQR